MTLMPREFHWRVVFLLATAICFLAVHNAILNFFFVHGAYFLDAGWFAYVTWRSDWLLHSPDSHPWGAVPYLRQHFALWFLGLNGLSYLLPVSHVGFMAIWMGGIYVLGFIVGLAALRPWLGELSSRHACPLLVGGALAFAFNVVALDTLMYPHPEILIPFVIIALLLAIVAHRRFWSVLLLIFALSLRTDVGFHVFLFAAGAGIGLWLDGHRNADAHSALIRRLIAVAAISFGYSALAYGVQALFLPGGRQFSAIYLGEPPLSHVAIERIFDRASALFLTGKAFIFTGFVLCLSCTVLTRRWIYVLGAMAGLPWALVNLLAASEAASSFFTYYAFPFVVLLLWPLVFGRLENVRRKAVLVASLVALAISFLAGAEFRTLGMMLSPPPPSEQMRRTLLAEDLAARLKQAAYFDSALVSLVGHRLGPNMMYFPDREPKDTIVFFDRYMDTQSIRASADLWGLTGRCEELLGPIRLVSADPDVLEMSRALGLDCTGLNREAVTSSGPDLTR